MRHGWGSLGALMVAVAIGPSCVLRTKLVAQLFNAGAIDSAADPTRDPAERRRSLVVALLREELMDAYFRQGGHGHSCALVADKAAGNPDIFVRYVKCFAYGAKAAECELSVPQVATQSVHQSPVEQQALRERAHEVTKAWFRDELPADPLCKKIDKQHNELQEELTQRFADRVRFDLAIARAAQRLGELLREGLVDERALLEGARKGFRQAAVYLQHRRWQRSFDRPVTGLVVKGGAATGIYSAGVVWTALQLIHTCMSEPDCRPNADMRFRLLSGTSTGAMIVTAVDRFASADTPKARQQSLDGFVRWFTCYSLRDLYCVDTDSMLTLIDDRKGVIRFDGIQSILEHCVDHRMLGNPSELILNVVDFRSGRLLSLSDQGELKEPCDVVKAAVASAALPAIVEPIDDLPVDVPVPEDPTPDIAGTYLDGGIRSEIPLLALARRGAERSLVVSSGQSMLSDTGELTQAAKIAARYIDVSTGGVTESELEHAQRWVESVRFAELQECMRRLRHPRPGEIQPTCNSDGCNPSAVCEGRWPQACSGSSPDDEGRSLEQRIEKLWRVEKIFRNDAEVPPSAGYDFRPEQQRRLFQAGVEAARQRCLDLAQLLGLVDSASDVQQPLRKKLIMACSKTLPPATTCDALFDDDRPDPNDIEVRECGEPPPYLARACGGAPKEDEEPLCGKKK